MTLRFTILGCGSSPGVPRVHGEWGACNPDNPKNRRLRCSLLVERIGANGKTVVVIDTSPDFRQQMLNAGVKKLDGVIYTHAHADHVHGIDDLRGYTQLQGERITTYSDEPTFERLMQGFRYCYETPEGGIYPPILENRTIRAGEAFEIDGDGGKIRFFPILQTHANITSLGFRIGGDLDKFAGGLCYSSDISAIPDESVKYIKNLDVWIVDALQYRAHVSHFSLGEALEWIDKLKPKRSILTHMHIPLDYDAVMAETPDHVVPAYDGLTLELPVLATPDAAELNG
ncbi:MAG: MBL fold metallo-hydrolase [Rhizobiaceae bacterium]